MAVGLVGTGRTWGERNEARAREELESLIESGLVRVIASRPPEALDLTG